MKILFAMDASPTCQAAVNTIAARPWPPDTIVGIVHVVEPVTPGNAPAETDLEFETRMKAGHELVNRAAQRLTARGLETITAVTAGSPRTAILNYANLWRVDLILIGSLGMGIIPSFFLGSVAKKVVRESLCSVEILRPGLEGEAPGPPEGMKILLATDGSAPSQAAIRSILRRPWPARSEIRVISVAEPFESLALNWLGEADMLETIETKTRLKAQKAVLEAENILNEKGFTTSSTILIGSTKDIIVEEARNWGADLIVLGTRDQHGPDRILMGSVSDAVAIHAPCSVDVIRQPGL